MQIDPCAWRNTSRMAPARKYNNEAQVKLNNFRTTPTGLKNVHEMYCNKANGSMFASNVGDLLDEIGQGHYIIVQLQSPIQASPKKCQRSQKP